MAARFDLLLIDFYGTISAGDREAVEQACNLIVNQCGLPLSPRDFAIRWGERFFRTIDGSNHHAFRTLYECEIASLQETLEDMGVPLDTVQPAELVASIEAYWANPPLHPDAVELLARIDLPVCCVSNADTAPLSAAITRHGLRFDAVITSEAARCYKPQAEIFRLACRRLGVSPDRVLHVGDSLHSDVGGATQLGITTAWICRADRIHDIGTARADFRISSLSELDDILYGSNGR